MFLTGAIFRKLHHDLKEGLEQFRLHLLERDELTPLKLWQVQDLGYQAAQRVVLSNPDEALSVLTEISQNFPIAARSISRQVVKKEFSEEVHFLALPYFMRNKRKKRKTCKRRAL